jgi:hypothetical protein
MEKLYNIYIFLFIPVFLINQFVYKLVTIPPWLNGLLLILGALLFFTSAMKKRKKDVK